MRVYCEPKCVTTVAAALAAMPCFYCVDSADVLQIGTFFNTPPSVANRSANDPQYLLAGSGIGAEFASVARTEGVELVLAPVIAGIAVVGPSVGGAYAVNLATGQHLAIVFGVASLRGPRITDYYDVELVLTAGGGSASATLIDDLATPSTYTWDFPTWGPVTDNAGGPTVVQNVEQIRYLVTAGVLPAGALLTGTVVAVLRATDKVFGDVTELQITVNQTVA